MTNEMKQTTGAESLENEALSQEENDVVEETLEVSVALPAWILDAARELNLDISSIAEASLCAAIGRMLKPAPPRLRFPLLGEDQIEVKVKKITKTGVVLLLYKTARVDMDLLDEVVGPENWTCEYREIKGNLYCGIGIKRREDSPFVWKWDCGVESREDGEGNEKKGEASDSFKRAGFKWGIGRELYTSPFIFAKAEKCNIKDNNGKLSCYDDFEVEKIAYDESGRKIKGLAVVNNSTGKRCFVWQEQ